MTLRTIAKLPTVALLFLLAAMPLQARDTEALSQLLVPAFMAKDFVMICSLHNPPFVQETSGPRGSAFWYAQHMRQEVIAALPESEARAVVVEAAGIVKSASLKVVRGMASGGLVDQTRLNAWCASSARPFIQSTMARHDSQHALFDEMIAKAKQ